MEGLSTIGNNKWCRDNNVQLCYTKFNLVSINKEINLQHYKDNSKSKQAAESRVSG